MPWALAPPTVAAIGTATAALQKGFDTAARAYAGGWHQYVASLRRPEPQYQRQFQMAAMVLRAHEDKLHPGALAASLTIPWGNASDASMAAVGGYHVVWSRDLYQAATAFLAMGDRAAALRGLNYLFNTQQRPDGSFPQNSWLDGKPWWTSLQLDEVSYPIILAWQLNQTDTATYEHHVRTAANFLVQHGPATPEERWEEMSGYSPSTTAAEIAGLICAADIARKNGDSASADRWTGTADAWARDVNAWMVTTTGPYGPRYFIRIAPHGDPNSGEKLVLKNGTGTWDEREIVDAGFLELVRLGIRSPNDPVVAESVKVIDRTIMVNTPAGPGWYRYSHDGYGEHANGEPYNGTGIGRLWTLLTGERGEYELANGRDAKPVSRHDGKNGRPRRNALRAGMGSPGATEARTAIRKTHWIGKPSCLDLRTIYPARARAKRRSSSGDSSDRAGPLRTSCAVERTRLLLGVPDDGEGKRRSGKRQVQIVDGFVDLLACSCSRRLPRQRRPAGKRSASPAARSLCWVNAPLPINFMLMTPMPSCSHLLHVLHNFSNASVDCCCLSPVGPSICAPL